MMDKTYPLHYYHYLVWQHFAMQQKATPPKYDPWQAEPGKKFFDPEDEASLEEPEE
jgi:hypothetical protein